MGFITCHVQERKTHSLQNTRTATELERLVEIKHKLLRISVYSLKRKTINASRTIFLPLNHTSLRNLATRHVFEFVTYSKIMFD